jgi:5-methylthioadenosine/S-adenosylhomocysteine deaminase
MSRILIEHVDVLTPCAQAPLGRDLAIAIDGATIASVGPAPHDFVPDERVDGRGLVAVPGLFNAHCHAAMTLERGWAEDLPFPRWLNEKIWVAESALEEEDVYWGAALAACEMIRGGIVAFADHYFWMDQVARLVAESGMKALLGWCIFGLGREREVGGIDLDTVTGFARRWHGQADGRIRTVLAPHSPYMCPPELLRQLAEAAGELGIGIHLHLSESEEQVTASRERYGRSPVAHVAELGVLDVPTLAAHCIAVDAADIALLAQKKVSVAHTPKTYLKLAMGMTPVRALLDAGVNVALGTDGPASNADLNLLEVMRLVGLLQKAHSHDAAAMPIPTVLRLGSANGARALGFGCSGTIAAGAAADLALLDTRGVHWHPRHDLGASVVYAAHPSDVSHLLVDGRWLLRKGELCTLDEERIRFEAERRAMRMVGQPMALVRAYGS